ncbi:MAG TPA: DUF1329 domain-containing protein [Candidatus Binataceae bacterium]|nr:DUF1329 domain-containing protein [Candidatus Binataceae bacterium]
MKVTVRIVVIGLVIALLPSLGLAQTDRSAVDDWLKATAKQTDIPPGTTITMANWQQYQDVMPLGMIKLFQGTYGWKMPADVSIPVGPAHLGGNLPKSWVEATEQHGSQTGVEVLPNGHYVIKNYYGGTPFPNPQEPYKGWKVLANVFWAYVEALYVNTPKNYGSVWAVDRFGDIAPSTFDVVYRWSAYITDQGFPHEETYAPGTWYTEWGMQETPEQARYTASLSEYYQDQETHPFPDTFVFVPALRRSLRLSTTSRCSPVFGFDWSYDDAKTNGFNGSTSVYTGDYLGDRKILTLAVFNQDGSVFPEGYDMPLAWPKPSWGKWEVRPMAVDDIKRIPSEAAGYCYASRIVYADKEFWDGDWVDLFDSNKKLWKSIAYFNDIGDVPGVGHTWDGVASMAWDLQNTHMTVWSGFGNPWKRKPYLNFNAPKEYFDGVKYGSPSGLMQILR